MPPRFIFPLVMEQEFEGYFIPRKLNFSGNIKVILAKILYNQIVFR